MLQRGDLRGCARRSPHVSPDSRLRLNPGLLLDPAAIVPLAMATGLWHTVQKRLLRAGSRLGRILDAGAVMRLATLHPTSGSIVPRAAAIRPGHTNGECEKASIHCGLSSRRLYSQSVHLFKSAPERARRGIHVDSRPRANSPTH